MPMHRVFELPEIVETILMTMPHNRPLSDLLSYARVCSTWLIPATTVYWKAKEVSLHQLFRGDILARSTPTSPYEFKRMFEGADELFLLERGKLVRRVCVHSKVDFSVLEAISQRNALPNLIALRCQCRDAPVWPLTLLLGPTVTRIEISLSNTVPNEECIIFLNTLRHGPLTHIDLSRPDPSPAVLNALEQCLTAHPRLRFVMLWFRATKSLLTCLGTLPSLETLGRISFTDDGLGMAQLEGQKLFPKLQELEMHGHCTDPSALLRCISSPFLRFIKFTTILRAETLREAFSVVGARWNKSLQEISFTNFRVGALPSQDPVLTVACLNLLTCPSLTHVDISSLPCCIAMTDQEVADLAKACRHLKLLRLNCSPDTHLTRRQHPQTTLKCLTPLALHCRQLATLGILLDAAILPGPEEEIAFPSMKKLEVGLSPIDDSVAVAKLFERIFNGGTKLSWSTVTRNVDDLWERGDQYEERCEGWRKVVEEWQGPQAAGLGGSAINGAGGEWAAG